MTRTTPAERFALCITLAAVIYFVIAIGLPLTGLR